MSTFIVWQQLAARQSYAQRIFICQTRTISRNIVEKKMDRKELEVGSHSKPTPRKSTQHRKEVRDPHAHVKPVYIEYVIKLLINRATRVDTTEHWGSVEPYRKIQRRRFVTYRIFSTVNYSLRFASLRWKHLRDNFIDRWNGSKESY